MTTKLRRREALIAAAGAVTGGVAGCLASSGDDDPPADDASGELGDPTGRATVGIHADPTFEFAPTLVHLQPGGSVEWTVVDDFRHTVAAYHPETYGPQRIPDDAEPWHSGLLRDGSTFEWTFESAGIYDYVDTRSLCSSHEAIGGVGRVVVGWPDIDAEPAYQHNVRQLPSRAETVLREIDERCYEVLSERAQNER